MNASPVRIGVALACAVVAGMAWTDVYFTDPPFGLPRAFDDPAESPACRSGNNAGRVG